MELVLGTILQKYEWKSVHISRFKPVISLLAATAASFARDVIGKDLVNLSNSRFDVNQPDSDGFPAERRLAG